ncbi:MAG: hypothetical protein WA117_00365 [Verrucomicrobiia bacterium]
MKLRSSMRIILLFLLSLWLWTGACHNRSSSEQENNNGIGTAEMAADGTITLQLRAEGKSGGERAVGDAMFVYKKDDPKYKDILDHLGGMKPGESKFVKPWPEPTAAGKTNGLINVPRK